MKTFQAFFTLWLAPEEPKLKKNAGAFLPEGITVEEAERFNRLEFFAKITEMFAALIKPVS
jgi:hypothetical protein